MKKIIIICAFLFTLISCDKEGQLIYSDYDQNWLTVADSDDPVDHLIYEIYNQSGIPIFYEDTVGAQLRTSPITGEQFMYHYKLKVFYKPGSQSPSPDIANYTEIEDSEKSDLVSYLEFIQSDIIPKLPKTLYVPSIFLVKELKSPLGSDIYAGFESYVLSHATRFKDYSPTQKEKFVYTILTKLIDSYINQKEQEWLQNEFCVITDKLAPGKYLYTPEISVSWKQVHHICGLLSPPILFSDPRCRLATLGFIEQGHSARPNPEDHSAFVPKRAEDITDYVEAVLTLSRSEFSAKHTLNVDMLLKKFDIMREKLVSLGLDLPEDTIE